MRNAMQHIVRKFDFSIQDRAHFEYTRKILSKEKLSRLESPRVSITDYYRYVNFNDILFRIQRYFLIILELYENNVL